LSHSPVIVVSRNQKQSDPLVLVLDGGKAKALVRRLEKLNAEGFTYSREMPRNRVAINPAVRIYVVHTPYPGPLKTLMATIQRAAAISLTALVKIDKCADLSMTLAAPACR
jgi:hypothetical protein